MERPIYTMLSKYIERDPIRLHMPGHKGIQSPYDVTEIPQTDDLNQPGAAIKRAQQLLAGAFGASHSHFLVGGSTAGIHTMLLYAQMIKNAPIIIPRSSHRSAFSACCLYGIDAIVAQGAYDTVSNVSGSCEYDLLEAMEENQEAGAVLVTRPDYYGRCMDLRKVAEKAKQYGMLLVVDEAHGAHYAFGDNLPDSASGVADIWVHSAHKTLNALTPGAYLHCKSHVEESAIDRILSARRTSSPSFPLLMSLDDTRAEAETNRGQWDERGAQCQELAERINAIEGLTARRDEWVRAAGFVEKDATRLVIDVRSRGGGFEVARQLYDQHRIQVEMADFQHIVAIMTPWDQGDWDERLLEALKALPVIEDTHVDLPDWPVPGKRHMPMRDAWCSRGEWVDMDKAVGCIAVTSLGCYPPGTPIILPGEEIAVQAVEYMWAVEAAGGTLFGATGNKIKVV